MGRLDGRVTHITGAASGIGAACAARFVEEGAIVVGSDVQEPDSFPGASFEILDVRDADRQKAVADAIVAEHGRIDVIITAAGVGVGGAVHSLSLEDWQRCQDINLTGTMLTAKMALPSMIANRSGSIITVASVEGLEGCEGGSTYNASKGGVVLLTKNMACDYGPAGIRANTICPGFIKTPMLENTIQEGEFRDKIIGQHKLRRLGEAHELAGPAVFLASDDASFVTGVALPVDGGYHAGHSYGLGELLSQL